MPLRYSELLFCADIQTTVRAFLSPEPTCSSTSFPTGVLMLHVPWTDLQCQGAQDLALLARQQTSHLTPKSVPAGGAPCCFWAAPRQARWNKPSSGSCPPRTGSGWKSGFPSPGSPALMWLIHTWTSLNLETLQKKLSVPPPLSDWSDIGEP